MEVKMNIIVALKQIPDLQQIRIRDRKPIFDDVPLTVGPIEKNALEAAVKLRETMDDCKVIALSAGNDDVEDTIKEALAAGADEAVLVIDDSLENTDSSYTAVILAEALGKIEDKGLILFGEGSGDNYSGQVGSRVAEILGYPQVGYAKSIEINGNTARIIRSLEEFDETVEVQMPAVVSIMADINEPRIPAVTQILKAGKKPKQIFDLDDFDLKEDSKNTILTLTNIAPVSERKNIQLKTADELVDKLKSEGIIGR